MNKYLELFIAICIAYLCIYCGLKLEAVTLLVLEVINLSDE